MKVKFICSTAQVMHFEVEDKSRGDKIVVISVYGLHAIGVGRLYGEL